jgi:hypothetical protein
MIMIAGILWRLSGLIFFRIKSRAAKPKSDDPVVAGLRTVALRSVRRTSLKRTSRFST